MLHVERRTTPSNTAFAPRDAFEFFDPELAIHAAAGQYPVDYLIGRAGECSDPSQPAIDQAHLELVLREGEFDTTRNDIVCVWLPRSAVIHGRIPVGYSSVDAALAAAEKVTPPFHFQVAMGGAPDGRVFVTRDLVRLRHAIEQRGFCDGKDIVYVWVEPYDE